jgi:hypothetical protein
MWTDAVKSGLHGFVPWDLQQALWRTVRVRAVLAEHQSAAPQQTRQP